MSNLRFHKHERLKSHTLITRLFKSKDSFLCYPLLVKWETADPTFSSQPLQILIGASSKKFKQAVQRNRVKRLIREAVRVEKQAFLDELNSKEKKIILSIICIGNEIPDLKTTTKTVRKALKKVATRIG